MYIILQVDIAIVAASADGTSHLWVLRGDTGNHYSTHLTRYTWPFRTLIFISHSPFMYLTGQALEGYPMSLPSGAIASASVLLVG
jgi:hypothetical protein